MEYSNPRVPEGINVSQEHPLKELAQLLVGGVIVVVAAVTLLAAGAGYAARWIPFETEERLAAQFRSMLPDRVPLTDYLQGLADRLDASGPRPDDVRLHVHYVDAPVVNAMATVGGNIFLYRGLLEAMPNENALAMVIAHEIAHVRHRDPVVALGRASVVSLAMATLGFATGFDTAADALGQAGLLTQLSFNRAQENAADEAALAMVAAVYGHVQECDVAFEKLLEADELRMRVPEFVSTHPSTPDRIENLRRLARGNGFAMSGTVTPLPAEAKTAGAQE